MLEQCPPPCLVDEVPAYGANDACFERFLRDKAELVAVLGGIDCVTGRGQDGP